jgi:hypothetical protein
LNKQEIEHYLEMLGQELAIQGRQGSILLLGGVVMLICVGNRTSTRDIDASFEREGTAIRQAAIEIARREKLPSDWINDGAKGFLRSKPPISLWKRYPGLEVYMPELEYLLAMKVVARRDRDIDDARALIQQLKISDAEEVLNILKQYIPQNYLTPSIQYMVEDWFD